ncbi:hypothetical protein [Halalkalibacter akibai]|uniref:Uncharacterized protein n=1 Tax=Halalkalibacter akibai (strain ATCC 43226 / DSM 21942 / CIP 109018 / JCM 9157 / 1139) TaxID=1236973 RepID=W4QY28_HALA3|nr:hypothetical protein [Halalkalibacter akibai]GAE36822.1 hypothetical protein JCM9157_4042 [Halalkalibacter akibai JCM 9157]
MSLIGVSNSAGIPKNQVTELITKGKVSSSIASKLNTTKSSIEQFINGKATAGFATVLGTTKTATQELRDSIGWEGAIGLIIGLRV